MVRGTRVRPGPPGALRAPPLRGGKEAAFGRGRISRIGLKRNGFLRRHLPAWREARVERGAPRRPRRYGFLPNSLSKAERAWSGVSVALRPVRSSVTAGS